MASRAPRRKIRISDSDVSDLMRGPQTRQRAPRKQSAGVMGTSPYYWNYTTIDRRWDK